MSKAEGLWYEIAFHDVAQVGTRCQTFTDVMKGSGEISQAESVRYGSIPYRQTIEYEPTSEKKGVYSKHRLGASYLQLPTVIVDVVDGKDGKYSLMTEYTELSLGVTKVTELRVVARTPTLDAAALQKTKDVAASVGIDRSIINSLQLASHANCPEVRVGSTATVALFV